MWFNFPNAQDTVANPIQWEMVNSNYKGTIKNMGSMAYALIDPSGKLLHMEKAVHQYYLPDKIKTYLKANYDESKIVSIIEITDENGKEIGRAHV